MNDSCRLNSSDCQNGGQCIIDAESNGTFCKCTYCYTDVFCTTMVAKQYRFDVTYTYFLGAVVGLVWSFLNNILSLEVFAGCSRIRRTNCGIYLTIYCLLSTLCLIVWTVNCFLNYYFSLVGKTEVFDRLKLECYLKTIYITMAYCCVWLTSCVLLESGLTACCSFKTTGSRWRSVVVIFVVLLTAVSCIVPYISHSCDSNGIPPFQKILDVFLWFYPVTALVFYITGSILIVVGFASRVRQYEIEKGSFIRTFLKLLHRHLFVYVPMFGYILAVAPYWLKGYIEGSNVRDFPCGISLVEFILLAIVTLMQGLPFCISWLLFVFPSQVYLNEYYLHTWSGSRLARIAIYFHRRDTSNVNNVSGMNTSIRIRDNSKFRREFQ